MELRPNWYEIGNKACYIPKISKFNGEKLCLYYHARNYHIWYVNLYFTNQCKGHNAKDAIKFNFEGLDQYTSWG